MVKVLLTLHIVAVIFLIGPLVGSANSAFRAMRSGETSSLRAAARLVTIYGWASIAVLVFGAALVQGKDKGVHVEFGEGWVIASLILFLVAFGLVVGVLRPTLNRAVAQSESGGSVSPLVGRVAALTGVASLIYLVLAVLMVYRP